jgi:hypothetical protein
MKILSLSLSLSLFIRVGAKQRNACGRQIS